MKLSSMNCPSYDMSFYMKYLCNRSGLCYFQGEGGIFLNSKFKHYKRWLHSLLLLLIFPGGYAPPNSPGRGTFHVLIFRNVYFSCTIRIYFFCVNHFVSRKISSEKLVFVTMIFYSLYLCKPMF